MTAAFFAVFGIGFIAGVAFAAWRQVAYEARLRAYREQWSPPLGSPPTNRPLRGSDLAAYASEEEKRTRYSLRKPW